MSECTAITHTLMEYELLVLGSEHPTVLFTDHEPIIFLFTQNQIQIKFYRFQLILMNFANLQKQQTMLRQIHFIKIHHLKQLHGKTNRELTQNIKLFLAKDETSRLDCKYAVKTDPKTSQMNNL